ncbi:MAG: glyceraldehyde 3-phosphate dehydrogenase NAD-binding domain-containing protein [Acidobacteriota bacterium]
MARVAINGLGRVGRLTLTIAVGTPTLELVAANELASPEDVVYLLRYDSVYGRYDGDRWHGAAACCRGRVTPETRIDRFGQTGPRRSRHDRASAFR